MAWGLIDALSPEIRLAVMLGAPRYGKKEESAREEDGALSLPENELVPPELKLVANRA
jgi:hypothetical protein